MNRVFVKKWAPFVVGMLISISAIGQLPYQNPNLSSTERERDLISRLTLEEKASLMQDQSPAIPRLGIKKFNWWSEAFMGLPTMTVLLFFLSPSVWPLHLMIRWCIKFLTHHRMKSGPNTMKPNKEGRKTAAF